MWPGMMMLLMRSRKHIGSSLTPSEIPVPELGPLAQLQAISALIQCCKERKKKKKVLFCLFQNFFFIFSENIKCQEYFITRALMTAFLMHKFVSVKDCGNRTTSNVCAKSCIFNYPSLLLALLSPKI